MIGKAYAAWLTTGLDMWMLGAESGAVITRRMRRIAAGGSAGTAEAELMVKEKVQAVLEVQTSLITGAFGSTPLSGTQGVLRHYRRKVAANQRRLSRTP